MRPPRYQAISGHALTMLSTDDGGALIRLIAGELAGLSGPGVTQLDHNSLDPAFISFAHVLTGRGTAGTEKAPTEGGQLAVFGPGDHMELAADPGAAPLDVLLLAGLPLREAIAHYGPFVMNTREEISKAIADYEAGRLGIIPADHWPRTASRDSAQPLRQSCFAKRTSIHDAIHMAGPTTCGYT